jgi:predicted Fe-S protein YdhL (DUF1289 family)
MNDDALPDHLLDASPCIGVCRLDAGGRCQGCRRSAQQIGAWRDLTPQQRDAINRRNLPHAHAAVGVRLIGRPLGPPRRRGGRRNR